MSYEVSSDPGGLMMGHQIQPRKKGINVVVLRTTYEEEDDNGKMKVGWGDWCKWGWWWCRQASICTQCVRWISRSASSFVHPKDIHRTDLLRLAISVFIRVPSDSTCFLSSYKTCFLRKINQTKQAFVYIAPLNQPQMFSDGTQHWYRTTHIASVG